MVKGYISKIITGLLTVGFGVALVTAPVSALGEGGAPAGINAARGDNTPSNLVNGDSSIVRRAINIMLFGVGVLSVVMLIFGGFRYVISGGKKESVTNAKNTILYAIIGLLVAVFAYAIINFILGAALSGGSTTNV
ncbi:hypothetical protein [Candidatus Nanosynbacter sp. HMT-352]|jgi:hypothetical protein|uniref:hypothetical protein n=1 Tax=Candidatus Nanosynbacter sp. HMT-352 TaxID=2899133 RepID=UPI001E57CCA8|nr:hypothetical protein [Candidatus Nanosynbacter sp. HMT-352]UHA57355.1 hypothetical protein LR957_03495 [Candidatus Nanosynbacter sp. HMT-352]